MQRRLIEFVYYLQFFPKDAAKWVAARHFRPPSLTKARMR
jgi:hypothetical protein